MKKIIQAIQFFYYVICNFRMYLNSKKYERLIKKGKLNLDKEKIQLLRDAAELIPKKTKKGLSKYIPMTFASRMKIKAVILSNFGMKMKVLGIRITDDLKFI